MGIDKEGLRAVLKIHEKTARIREIEALMADPAFWTDQERSRILSREHASLQKFVTSFESATTPEALRSFELAALLGGPHDEDDAVVSIYAGAGGTDAQDWAEMLLRMYLKFAESKGFQTTVLDQSAGEEAGIKSATVRITGKYAYGFLKGEAGVHRLVRLSPYNAKSLRQTSFALVDVIPEFVPEALDLKSDDLKIETFRSGGHGGQSVNTTDSAVRITHLPTQTTVSVQNERSQFQNRETAMKILRARVAIKQEEAARKKTGELRATQGVKREAEFGSQIRNYVMHPYRLVKDVRTDYETADVEGVLNGQLEPFVEEYLKQSKSQN